MKLSKTIFALTTLTLAFFLVACGSSSKKDAGNKDAASSKTVKARSLE